LSQEHSPSDPPYSVGGSRLRLAPGPVPLGYENANSATATQVFALCVLALLDDRRERWRRALLTVGAAAAFAAVIKHGSLAGIATALPVAAATVWMALRPTRRSGWAAGAGLLSLGVAGAALLRLAASPTWPDALLRSLDPVRQRMWAAALDLWAAHLLIGAGPGAYVEVNPYGHDPDTMAAHSSLLQIGSELGLVGVILTVALIGGGFLLLRRGRPAHAVVAAAAWTALWVHSLVDHLFDYPALPLLAALVLGWAANTTTVQDPR